MTTYTYPTSGRAFALAGQTWTQRHNSRVSTSSLNGAIQTTSLPGMRWGVTLDYPMQTYAERAELMGWLSRLGGQTHRVALWDLTRPTPGNLAGSPLVNGAVAQFAITLAIDGAISAGRNLLRYSQEFDNGLWVKSQATVTTNATTAPDGSTTADKLVENSTVSGTYNMIQTAGALSAGQTATFSCHYKAAERGWVLHRIFAFGAVPAGAYCYVNLATGSLGTTFGAVSAEVFDAGNGWWRVSISAAATASGGVACGVFVALANNGGTYSGTVGSGLYSWGAQLEIGARTDYTGPPSATPGDWLSLPLTAGGSQLVQVVNSTVGEALTGVEFAPMLRGAVADNAAIGIVRPTALFVLASPELSIPRGASGMCPPFSVELIEVFS